MGDPNASIPTPEPVLYRPMFAAAIARSTAVTFLSAAAVQAGLPERLGLLKRVSAVLNTRRIGKRDMIANSATPTIEVDPSTYAVYADGVHLVSEPAVELPMAQRYFLF
jgi:urease subunit alpha